jgi:hypothetical protein
MPHDKSELLPPSDAIRPADFYRWRLRVTRLATPQEVEALRASGPRLPRTEREWLAELVGRLTREITDIQGFTREAVGGSNTLYRTTADTPRSARTLLVAFTSSGLRMLVETCVFLQHLPAGTDVLMLRDDHKLRFLSGAEGLATNFTGLTEAIDELAAGYGRVQTMGASSGGYAALLSASAIGAERGIAVGGGPPRLEEVRSDAAHARDAEAGPPLLCVYAEDHEPDRRRAESLADCFDRTTLVVVTNSAEHTLLNTARTRRVLGTLLRTLLEEDLVTSVESATGPGRRVVELPPADPEDRTSSLRRLNTRMDPSRGRTRSLARRVLRNLPAPRSVRQRLVRIAFWRFGLVVEDERRRSPRRR